MEARWTRIWWVRPVSRRHSTWVQPEYRVKTLQWVTAGRPFRGSTAIFFRSTGWRPMGASTVPESSRKLPTATASYTRAREWSWSCSARARWALSFFAAMMRPEVSRSMRWTMPGRSSPLIPESVLPQW